MSTHLNGFLLSLARGAWLAACLVGMALHADDELLLCDFENDRDLRMWDVNAGQPRLVQDGATRGERALEITFDPAARYNPGYLYWRRVRRDWSDYDALALDVFNPMSHPVAGYVLIADQAWRDKGGSYWNRHNGGVTFAPGKTQWVISVRGLYRGEAGSRNNDIKRNIDPNAIVRVDFGFGRRGETGRIVVDNLRLVRSGRPSGVWAFDFGPPNQSLMLSWTPVSHQTVYNQQRGFGWGPRGGAPWNGAARDTTFASMLLQDFCEAGRYNFRIDVPPGVYRLIVFYENCGYWGGEQARQRSRRILVDGAVAWEEERPDAGAHPLYRFEDVEPVGADVWEQYMAAEIAAPAEFTAEAQGNSLNLRFEADRVWGSKIAGLIACSNEDAAAAAWVAEQRDEVEKEFRQRAVCLDRPEPGADVPVAWQARPVVAWPVGIDDTVTPASVPAASGPGPSELRISRRAVRGEFEPFCLAMRPLRDMGECRLAVAPFAGPATLDAVTQVAWYNTSRAFNTIAYRIKPHTLREQSAVTLRRGTTRQVVVTVHIGRNVPPGSYTSVLRVLDQQGREVLAAPLELKVSPVVLDTDTEFLMGFFGLMPPGLVPEEQQWPILDQTLQLLRDHGMNAVCGGPSWTLTGWRGGKPVIDYGDTDRFFELLRRHGFDRSVGGYGGLRFRNLHQRYQRGDAAARVAMQSGLDYEDAFARAWDAVAAHAKARKWPRILYAMCDETRVRDVAERELDFMRLMGKTTARLADVVRSSGSYSVHFRARPTDRSDLTYWHQRFFEALDISSLNNHDQTVMDEARRLGKEVHIYNQGRTRYSFGLYQWSEFRKGVAARWQWHLNVLHGYQFFDLDGREPDTAMICYGRERIHPTIHFERCREGAEDFYLCETLRKTAAALPRNDLRAAAARSFIDDLLGRVKLNQRSPPEGYNADALKARVIDLLEALGEAG